MYLPERIICLTEETTETLYLLGADERIVGISGYTVRPMQARKEKPKVSAFTSANIRKIMELRPDLVLAFSDIQADIAAELARAGIQVLVFNQRTISEIFQMIATLGAIVGRPDEAHALIRDLTERLENVRSKTLDYKPRVYFEEWDDPHICGIRWVSELIEVAGGHDVFKNLSFEKGAKNRVVDSSAVVSNQPDIIVASWCGKKVRPEKIKSRKGWDKIPAVLNDHVYEIKSPLILQPGPACLTDGLDELVRIIRCYKPAIIP